MLFYLVAMKLLNFMHIFQARRILTSNKFVNVLFADIICTQNKKKKRERFKYPIRKTTRPPRVSGVQSSETEWKGLNIRYPCDGAHLRAVFSSFN